MNGINGQSILGVLFGSSGIVISNNAPGWMRLAGKITHVFIGNTVGVCDGVADDVEIQACIAAAPETKLSAGDFFLTAPINTYVLGRATVIRGAGFRGTSIYQPSGSNLAAYFYASVSHNSTSISDMRLEGGKANAVPPVITVGIDGTNLVEPRISDVECWNFPSHGFKETEFLQHCSARQNNGWGFYNAIIPLVGHALFSANNGTGGYYLAASDVNVSHFKADNELIGVHILNGFSQYLSDGEITVAASDAGGIGILTFGHNPGAIISDIIIDMQFSASTGISISQLAVNQDISTAITGVVIRGNQGVKINQIGIDIPDGNTGRCVVSGFTIDSVGGKGIRFGTANGIWLFMNGFIARTTTPLSLAAGEYGTNYILDNVLTNISTDAFNIFHLSPLAHGQERSVSSVLTPTGSTLANGTGTFTGSPITLLPGANVIACTVAGTATITLPAGSTGTAVSGTMAVTGSPVALVGGANIITTTGAIGNITVTTNAIGVAIPCPETQNCLISRIEVDITTPGGTATSVIQVGIANDAIGTGLGAEFFTGINANAAAIRDSYLAGDTGAQTKFVAWAATGAGSYIVGQIQTQIAQNLVGRITIFYIRR